MTTEFVAIILAAGQGTRMKSELPKVLHSVAGLPMYAHVTQAALNAGASKVVLVVGHGREAVRADVSARFDARVTTAVQEKQLGTGDAIRAGLTALDGFSGWVLALCGDTPLVHEGLVKCLRDGIAEARGPMLMLTSEIADPTGYGRILRDASGNVTAIREHKDASPAERAVREVNPAIYAFEVGFLRGALSKLSTNNAQGEYYLTDVVAQAAQLAPVHTIRWPFEETQGVNDRAQLSQCESALRLRFATQLARSGVTVRELATLYADVTVSVEPDAVLEPNVHLRGKTRIAAGAHVDTGCVLSNVQVARSAYLKPYTIGSDSSIGENAQTGPFSHLRPDSVMEADSHIGNFVEMKKTRLGKGSKANHLAYLGDGQIGEQVNVGAGTIFCNYDGVQKHTTILEDGVFIGSDSQLVAPVRIGKGAYVGTGTTVTVDVPADALALSRPRQVNKEGYAVRLRARFKAAKEKSKQEK
ncbi:MAG TPA: bifunctional UDP-N-acetylglucosamine diphosphorylase/glucosamine-1-phosphate N-acetyltransferase GlmU [Polyangiales bacterium]|nr:bifunctional UDP-N-acetylglucosamine diphosphorylase/glucosamine-1-phosphate N-acetyltransferase GlmU [Polyangiales bacterium]